MRLTQQAGDREAECWLGGKLAILYQRRGEISRARMVAHHYYQAALEIAAPRRATELVELLASLYCACNECEKGKMALAWANKSYELACANGYWRYRLRGLMRQAQAFLLLRDAARASDCAQQAVTEFEQRNQPLEEEPELFHTLARCAYAARCDIAAAASERARVALLTKAAWITDEELRQCFLVNHPLHRAILNTE